MVQKWINEVLEIDLKNSSELKVAREFVEKIIEYRIYNLYWVLYLICIFFSI
jgi:hypothetical protein